MEINGARQTAHYACTISFELIKVKERVDQEGAGSTSSPECAIKLVMYTCCVALSYSKLWQDT